VTLNRKAPVGKTTDRHQLNEKMSTCLFAYSSYCMTVTKGSIFMSENC